MENRLLSQMLSRRDLTKLAAAGALGAALLPVEHTMAMMTEGESSPERKTIQAVSGMHDTPDVGGSLFADQAMQDYDEMGVDIVVAYDPEDQFLREAQAHKKTLYVRTFLPGNVYDPRRLDLAIQRYGRYFPLVGARFIPFNEDNIESANPDPRKHAENWVHAFKHLSRYGILTGFTPFAQNKDRLRNDLDYHKDFLKNVKLQLGAPDLEAGAFFAIHSYQQTLNEDTMKRIHRITGMYEDAYNRQNTLPIAVTEAGLSDDLLQQVDRETQAQQLLRIMHTPLPDANIEAYCFWLYANFYQRPNANHNDPELQKFELAALRTGPGELGKTPAFRAFEQEAKKQRLAEHGIIFSAPSAGITVGVNA